MSKVSVFDIKGVSRGEIEVADDVLVLDRGTEAVHQAIVATLAGRRAGTASTLGKGAVAGSNKKPWQQKGTGQARAGYRQSPIWRGGGVAFGPHPRDFSQRVPKKTKRLAFQRALSGRIAEGAVKVLEKFELPDGKTKSFVALMKALKIKGPALIVTGSPDKKLVLAARNVPGIEVVTPDGVGTYQMVRYPTIVADRDGMNKLVARLGTEEGGRS